MQIVTSEEFENQMRDSKEEDRAYITSLFNTFGRDIIHWNLILESFPDSLKRRFIVEY